MVRIIIVCLLSMQGVALSQEYKDMSIPERWISMTALQRQDIKESFNRNKEFGFGYTMAAYNAVEAGGGAFLVRVGGPKHENSAGRAALRSKRVASLEYSVNIKNVTNWQQSRAMQKLMLDRDFDDRHIRLHITELLKRYNGDWMKVWQAWNGKKPGQAEEVRDWIRFFKKLEWE